MRTSSYIENKIISGYLLVLTAVFFFGIVESIDLKNRTIYIKLRNISMYIYLIHMYVWTFYYSVVYGEKTYGVDSFLFTIVISIIIGLLILLFKRKLLNVKKSRS
jgi:hypothetical protein